MKSTTPLLALLCCLLSSIAATLHAAPTAQELLKENVTSMVDSAKLSDPELESFKSALLASAEWQHQLCDAGIVDKTEQVIQHLFAIWKADKQLTKSAIDQAMATACALEGPRKGRKPEESLQRYQFFRDKHRLGLLNTMYDDLTVFQRRYLASGVQHGGHNSMESMEYLNSEVCLPAERYTGACWYAAYQLHSPFGDSIHGPDYYRPFDGSWGNFSEMVRNVGGVCGSLSNFGAAAAIANGVPASSMGEPGHCAYTVMIKPNQWQPAYSLSWKRGLHTSFSGDSWGRHMLNSKAHEDWDVSKKSGDLRRLAEYHLSKNRSEDARKTIRIARLGNPADWESWSLSIKILNDTKSSDQHWQELHQDVLEKLSPLSGEIAYNLLQSSIYPKVLPTGKDEITHRKNILLAYQKSIPNWGLGRWDYTATVKHQLKLLAGTPAQQDAFMVQIFALHAKENVFTPTILETQLANIGDDAKRKQQFIASIGKSLSKSSSGGNEFNNVITTMARKILPDAHKRGDKSSFQFIGKLTAKVHAPLNAQVEPFPGILLSSGGTFGIPNPGNRYDDPSRHWGVIELHGGDFHTAVTPAIATIQLGNFGKLSGVNIVTRNGQFARMVGAILQTSEDGATWTDVHVFKDHKRIHRVDLSDKDINAGYVRVIHNGQPSLHFNLFNVYGKKQN